MPRETMTGLPAAGGASANLRGMALMLAATLGFSAAHGIVRTVADELHGFETAFFRNLFGALLLLPYFLRHGLQPLRTQRPWLHVLRIAVMSASLLLFFQAISIAPLAKVIALGFTGPIFTTLLAALLLGERVGPWRWSAIACGFGGALLVVRPGMVEVDTGSVLTLASSVLFAIGLLMIRVLGRTDSTVTLTAWGLMLNVPFTLLPALPVWVTPQPETFAWLVALGLLAGLSVYAFTAAMRLGETAVVMPVDYVRLLWAVGIGYLFFDELPDLATAVGGTIIGASAGVIAWREYRTGRR